MLTVGWALTACSGAPTTSTSSGGVGTTSAEAASVVVRVEGDDVRVDGSPVVSLSSAVQEIARRGDGTRVVIEAKADLAYARLAELTEGLREAGIVDVRFVVIPADTGPVAAPAGSTAAPAAAAPAASPPADEPKPPAAAAEPPKSLPEVIVTNIGLHVGGGKNTDAEKAPFRTAVGKHFDDFRGCYRHSEEPAKGGVFGIDLRIPREGGVAKLSQPRTGMKGAEFRECVTQVFSKVVFERPAKGPTVISYSLKFATK